MRNLIMILTISFISCGDQRESLGIKYLSEESADSAIYYFKGLIKQQPENARYNFLLGKGYFLKNELDSAAIFMAKAKELGLQSSDLYLKMGLVAKKQGINVYQYFAKATALDSLNQEAWYQGGLAFAEWDSMDLAYKYFSKSIELDSSHHQSYADRSLVSYETYNFGQALKDVNKAIQLLDTAKYYYQRAVIHNYMLNPRESLLDCDVALTLDSTFYLARRYKISILYNQGLDSIACIEIFKLPVEEIPNDMFAFYESCN